MLVKLENPALLSKIIEIISELVTEVRIKLNEAGMSIIALDPANVSMVGFKLPREVFSQFESGNEVLGVNLENFKKILKRCSAGSSLVLEKRENMLNIQILGGIRRDFNLNLIEIETEEKELPNLEFSSRVEINSFDLISSIEDCAVVSDACSFAIRDGKFIIDARGFNSASSEFSQDNTKIDAINCRAKYSLEYLQKFVKGAKLCDKTVLHFAESHPLKMELRTPYMELIFILAPRVENEE